MSPVNDEGDSARRYGTPAAFGRRRLANPWLASGFFAPAGQPWALEYNACSVENQAHNCGAVSRHSCGTVSRQRLWDGLPTQLWDGLPTVPPLQLQGRDELRETGRPSVGQAGAESNHGKGQEKGCCRERGTGTEPRRMPSRSKVAWLGASPVSLTFTMRSTAGLPATAGPRHIAGARETFGRERGRVGRPARNTGTSYTYSAVSRSHRAADRRSPTC